MASPQTQAPAAMEPAPRSPPRRQQDHPPPPPPVTAREEGCFVGLTHEPLDVKQVMDQVRSPKAGAIVFFAGTTRDNFAGKRVRELSYSSYAPRALRTMLDICKGVMTGDRDQPGGDRGGGEQAEAEAEALVACAMVHRLGTVPVGEESVLVAASSPHRRAAFRAAEELLELCKERVEVWKLEAYEGEGEEGGAVWKANRDGAVGVRVRVGEGEGEGEGKKGARG